MLLAIPALFAGLILLVWGGEKAVEGASTLAARTGRPPLLVGLVVMGFGAAAPELVVAVTAAAQGHPALALGSAWGSNIVAMSLVLGVTLWIAPLTLRSRVVRRELLLMVAASFLTAALVWDGVLSRLDAGLLVLGFVALLHWSWRQLDDGDQDALARETRAEMVTLSDRAPRAAWTLALGWSCLCVGAWLLVWAAVKVALWLGVSDLVMGLSVVALGTTLPELAVCVIAARKGEDDIALGHVLGVGLFNTLAVAGLSGLIEPLDLPPQALWRDLLFMAALALGLFLLGRSERGPSRLGRRTGQALVGAYLLHLLAVLVTAGPG